MNDATPQAANLTLAEVQHRFWSMHEKSRSEAPSSEAERRGLLQSLRRIVSASAPMFVEAIANDYGYRSSGETLLAEVVPALMMIRAALANLTAWMRPERRGRSILFWPGRNEVHRQPKGVVLIISTWNYPLLLTVGPLVAALAAGNRVIVKPSELTPTTSALLKRRLEDEFGSDRVTVALGGAEVAEGLCRLPFDHILFTGSTSVGKKVMAAAAQNLVPVTLELGGKSPAIIHADCDLPRAVERIVRGKLLNAGQTCIAPDYALVPRGRVEDFLRLFRETASRFYPRILDNPDYTSIINDRHYTRLMGLIEDALSKGARIETIDPAAELAGTAGFLQRRKIAPTAIAGVSDEMSVAREEIFGPLLPVIAYDTLDEAIAYVNARPRPLALYYFDTDRSRIRQVLERTVAGGVTINDTIYHIAQDELPFGGIGMSGMGSYHGRDGFDTFSHAKGTFRQSRLASADLLTPPYDAWFRRIVRFVIRTSSGG